MSSDKAHYLELCQKIRKFCPMCPVLISLQLKTLCVRASLSLRRAASHLVVYDTPSLLVMLSEFYGILIYENLSSILCSWPLKSPFTICLHKHLQLEYPHERCVSAYFLGGLMLTVHT